MYVAEECIGEGSRSSFYMLPDGCSGFKSFPSKRLAEIAHWSQSKLAPHNLAPMVLSEVGRIRMGDNTLSDWGYITELAEILTCGVDCECCSNELDDLPDDSEILVEADRLVKNMRYHGFSFYDNHLGNLGYIYRNTGKHLVCIDFGGESVNHRNSPCDCLECIRLNRKFHVYI